MFISDRQKKILELIAKKQSIKIKELCRVFNTTEPTIRKDLQYLDKGGLLAYVRGGAYYIEQLNLDIPRVIRTKSMEAEKLQIAKLVVKDLENHMVIFIDSSTTTLIIANEIANTKYTLIVITNSLEIATILHKNPNIEVVFCGGYVNREHSACTSNITLAEISNYYCDIAILSCHGVSKELGFINGDIEIGAIKKAMAKNSKEVWMCIDHSKFGRMGIAHLFDLNSVSCVYTDKVPKDWGNILNCVKTTS